MMTVTTEEAPANSVPAAAVIPAPIAYIKVAAVKKLVVEFLVRCAWSTVARPRVSEYVCHPSS